MNDLESQREISPSIPNILLPEETRNNLSDAEKGQAGIGRCRSSGKSAPAADMVGHVEGTGEESKSDSSQSDPASVASVSVKPGSVARDAGGDVGTSVALPRSTGHSIRSNSTSSERSSNALDTQTDSEVRNVMEENPSLGKRLLPVYQVNQNLKRPTSVCSALSRPVGPVLNIEFYVAHPTDGAESDPAPIPPDTCYGLWKKYWCSQPNIDFSTVVSLLIDCDTRRASRLTFRFDTESPEWPIYVRSCYAELYDFLCEVVAVTKPEILKGMLVTGSPGIGNSFFLLYALIRRLIARQTTVFHTSSDDIWIFNSTGVYHTRKGALHKLPTGLGASRPWYLFDAKYPSSEYWSSCFLVYATSPTEESYKEFTKQSGPARWVMPVWTVKEFQDSYSLWGQEFEEESFLVWGPCPRDHRSSPYDDSNISRAINEMARAGDLW
ncbi:hypothetical protein D9758_010580 [Tetrapyrgos nigripes]|uniref:Uncharacterized protein n=1 Tax=Tetrapyrgos nigripes TaxID=182062 RepID=A0A8H5FYV7_9AGAR|nr:hypothetical protein D9758_010580 [Tetrapyrgos nigripes]